MSVLEPGLLAWPAAWPPSPLPLTWLTFMAPERGLAGRMAALGMRAEDGLEMVALPPWDLRPALGSGQQYTALQPVARLGRHFIFH